MDRLPRRREVGGRTIDDSPARVTSVIAENASLAPRANALAAALGCGANPIDDEEHAREGFVLVVGDEGIELRDPAEPGVRGVRIDLGAVRRDRRNLGRRQPIARAFGPRVRTVVDATAGLGHDAALLAALGYEVTAIERSPVLAILLRDAIERAGDELQGRLRLLEGDARMILPSFEPAPDAIYLDPMYPPRRKRSALARKSVRIVRRLVGDDPDAGELLTIALAGAVERVVVKRLPEARPLGGPPSHVITGKLVRYDVYVVRT